MDIKLIARMLAKIGVKSSDEATPEMIAKATKMAQQEMKDAPNNLISANKKNMEALQRAKNNITEANYADAPPSYPANKVGADEVNHRLAHDPNGFTMVPEGTGLPVVRGNTMPAAKPVSKALIPEVVDDVQGPMLPAVRKPTDAVTIVDDIAQKSGMSGAKKAGLVAAGTGATIYGLNSALSDKKESEAIHPAVLAAVAGPVANAVLGGGEKAPVQNRAPSDEVSSEAAKAPAPKQPAPQEMDYVKQLLAATKKRDELDFIDNMLMAGTTIGNALATPEKKADYAPIEALKAQNTKPVDDIKQKMKTEAEAGELGDVQALRDPKSEMSSTLRKMMNQLGYPVGDNVSGKQLKDMGINVYNLLAQKEARETARLNREATQGNMNLERTKQSVDRGIQNWKKGKAYETYQSAKSGLDEVNNAILSKDKIAAGTAFMRFAKVAQGDDSVVKSEDMKTLLGGTNYTPEAYASKIADLAKGKNVTDKELTAMKNIMERLVKKAGTKAFIDVSGHRTKIKNAGLDESEYINPVEAEEMDSFDPSKEEAGSGYTPAQEKAIELVMKNNKVDRNTAINALKKAKKL